MDRKLELEEVFNRIESAFASFFKEHNFKLKTSSIQEIIYENEYSELIFDFESFGTRFGYMAPANVLYEIKASHHRYTVKSMVEQLHKLDFEKLFEEYYDVKRLDYYVSYKEIISTYLNGIISDADFSWVGNFKDR